MHSIMSLVCVYIYLGGGFTYRTQNSSDAIEPFDVNSIWNSQKLTLKDADKRSWGKHPVKLMEQYTSNNIKNYPKLIQAGLFYMNSQFWENYKNTKALYKVGEETSS